MTLQELYDRLALGEMAQHPWCASGTMDSSKYPAVINALNSGLDQLHSIFPLIEKDVIIQQFSYITTYYLDYSYAESNTESEDVKYIMDTTDDPFLDDVIRIEGACNEVGCPIPLNDENDCYSWFTPTWDSIQIPYPLDTNVAVIKYRAKHPKITTEVDASLTYVLLPPVLEEAICAYIASRCFVSMGNQTSGQLSSYFSNRYQEQVQLVERYNLLQSSDADSNVKLCMKGFI